MQIEALKIKGAYLIKLSPTIDERGEFTRIFCASKFKQYNLISSFVQSSISYNKYKGVLRGMHYQKSPKGETKLVQCLDGDIYDVIIDIRKNSPTFLAKQELVLSSKDKHCLYIPEGCLHGFQSLTSGSKILYSISEYYYPEYQKSYAYNSKSFAINWPISNPILSERDKANEQYNENDPSCWA